MSGTLRRGSACPACAKAKLVPIVYGLPIGTAIQDSERGTIALGGCVVTGSEPELACLRCGARYLRDGALITTQEP